MGNQANALQRVLDSVNSQQKNIQSFLTELQNAKQELEQIISAKEATPLLLEQLESLEKRFNQNELQAGGTLSKKLAKFNADLEEADHDFFRITGKKLSKKKPSKTLKKNRFV